jgi:hypothetical protein
VPGDTSLSFACTMRAFVYFFFFLYHQVSTEKILSVLSYSKMYFMNKVETSILHIQLVRSHFFHTLLSRRTAVTEDEFPWKKKNRSVSPLFTYDKH